MRGQWCYYKECLKADYCEDLINYAKSLPMESADMKDHNGNFTRKSKISFIPEKDSNYKELYEIIWRFTELANSHWFNNINLTKLEPIQFAEYSSEYSGEYKLHQDVHWINTREDPNYHRKITAIVQLSNPESYTGGEFNIYNTEFDLPQDEIKQQGTLIIFPSIFFHEALPVLSGTRYSLTAWINGPKWR